MTTRHSLSVLEPALLAALAAAGQAMFGRVRRSGAEAPEPAPAPPDDTEAALSAVMETCGAAIALLDQAGVVRRANALAGKLFGVTSTDIVGRSLIESTLSADMAGLAQTAILTGAPAQAEVRIGGHGGPLIDVTATPVGAGQYTGVAIVGRDLSEVRRLETVRQDFVSNVSHELRTPLASIRAMAETLRDGALHDDMVADRFLETIVNESLRLARISDDLILLSQSEAGPPAREPLDLAALVRETGARHGAQAERQGIAFRYHALEHLPVMGSRDQLEQVLVNLMDNAIKYTHAGGSVDVRAEDLGTLVRVEVTDTGVGIMSQDQPRIFERFFRVDKARSRESGGTGLGLSIVKHIVEAHGGKVTVSSEYNHGSTFTVMLPRA